MEVSKSWPGVPRALWPSLNKLADAVNTALNWRTDGSLVVQVQGGQMTATMQLPQTLQAMILGGNTAAYSWAAVTPDDDGVWYIDSVQGLSGQAPKQVVSLITSASWNAGTLTFECQDDLQDAGVTTGLTVRVRGVNPIDFDDDEYVVTAVHENTFDVLVAASPGTYIIGGAACFLNVTNATEFRPAWEYNQNATVAVGKIVDIDVRTINSDTDQEYEYKFPYCCSPSNTTLIETTVSMNLNSRQNNFSVTNYTAYLLTAATNFSFTGFSGGVCGKVIELINSGSNNNTITVESNSTQSSAANQYGGANGASDVIGPQSSATYFYDCVRQKWIKKAGSGTASGNGVIDLTGSASDPPAQLLYETTSASGLDGWISVYQTTSQALTVTFEWVDYLGKITTGAGVGTGGSGVVANMGRPAQNAVESGSVVPNTGVINTFRIYGQTQNLGTPAPYRIRGRMV